jgi:SNF2 family DNA or RNA helicase
MYISSNAFINKLVSPEDTKYNIFSYHTEYIIVQKLCSNNNYTEYNRFSIISQFEKNVYFEIINNSKLWITEYIKISEFKININIYINLEYLNKYIHISYALNTLLTSHFNKLENFIKFNDKISYVPVNDGFEPPSTFKIKLFNYQKKSLYKMIKMENGILNSNIEYTALLNFYNTNIIFDPIKNIKSDTTKYFKIKSSGGILADEMGLGKTITTLSLISSNPSTDLNRFKYSESGEFWKINSKATLIITPSHIAIQWRKEAEKSNPLLKILTILTRKDHEKLHFKDFIDSDIIITSQQFLMNFKYYPTINYRINISSSSFDYTHRNNTLKNFYIKNYNNNNTTDNDIYEIIRNHENPLFEYFYFHRLVLDEGHEIFAGMLSTASMSRYMSNWLSSIDSNSYWYVSGTPFINYMGLINTIKFLNLELYDPEINLKIDSNMLTNSTTFNMRFDKNYLWENILQQLCIRHNKNNVKNDINFCGYTEIIEWVEFTELERQLYDAKKTKFNNIALQQFCCHPLNVDSTRRIIITNKNEELDLNEMQQKLIEYHTCNIEKYTKRLKTLDTTNPAYHMLKKTCETSIIDSNYILNILNKLNNTKILDESLNNCAICLEDIVTG